MKYFSLLIIACIATCVWAQQADLKKPAAVVQTPTTASIQDLMQSQVDPAADAIWESVSTVVTAAGIEEHQPRTPEEWDAVRQHALKLIEAAKLLASGDRPVVHPGKQVEDAHVAGILPAAKIQDAITANRAAFNQHAQALEAIGQRVLKAINARNTNQLIEVGGYLEGACEACHLRFWYPDAQRPTA